MKKEIIILLLLLSTSCTSNFKKVQIDENEKKCELKFDKAIEVADRIFAGIEFLKANMDTKSLIPDGYNYKSKKVSDSLSFNIGLSCISLFYATGDEKYLKIAKETADLLDSLLPKTNLVPEYYIRPLLIRKNSITATGTSGQTNVVEYVSHLALLDSSYIELTRRLTNGLMRFCINKENNLAYNVVSTNNGDLIKSESFGFESHLGAVSSSVVEALITAYKATNDNNYKNQAIATLKSIWSKRNRENNLIPETWDIVNDTIGTRLYPNGKFRYDDFGGAYIRALTLTYQYTQDEGLLEIMEEYTRALIDNIWDKRINGGAFRYLTNLDGKGPELLETMYGLFIATILNASQYLSDDLRDEIISKSQIHADNVFLTDYGVKNLMVPHCVAENGEYYKETNDSQLGYAVLQFPLGMNLLSIYTNNKQYRLRCNQIINTLIEKHKIGDNISSPRGFLNIVETQPPFGFEDQYGSPQWCKEFIFLPAYILFNSIVPSENVKIFWHEDNYPGVYGLVRGMPFWDIRNVHFEYSKKRLQLRKVYSKKNGKLFLEDLGFRRITKVFCDNKPFYGFEKNTLFLKNGCNKYEIFFEK